VIPIVPFQALRPTAAKARAFSCGRLEHLSPAHIQELAQRLGNSFAAIVQCSLDAAAGVAAGAMLLQQLHQSQALVLQPERTIYMHRQTKGGRKYCGMVACVPGQAFMDGSIRAHRAANEQHAIRWRSISQSCGAQIDSVVIGFESNEVIAELFEREINDRPLFHTLASDGATHTLWRGQRAADLAQAFLSISHGYLLEGHHRVRTIRRDEPVMCLLLPMRDVVARWSARLLQAQVLPQWHAWLRANAQQVSDADAGSPPAGCADACVISGKVHPQYKWYRFQLPDARPGDSFMTATEHGRLDRLLRSLFKCEPSLVSQHRPAIDDLMSLQLLLADSHEASVVVLSRPSLKDLTRLADAGELLPPGSTWFEPCVRSGLWMHHGTTILP